MNSGGMKNAFGKPGEGIHRFRLGGVAVVDVFFTLIASVIISLVFKWNLVLVIAGAFATGVAVHRVLRVNTALNVKLFGYLPD
jgi:hypothetical protein